MNKKQLVPIILLILFSSVLVLMLTACNSGSEETTAGNTDETANVEFSADNIKPVSVVVTEELTWSEQLQYRSELKAISETDLSMPVAGRIERLVDRNIGQMVASGDLIASLEKKDLQLNAERTRLATEDALVRKQRLDRGANQPQIDNAVLQIDRGRLRIEQLQTELDRTTALYEAGAVPKVQLEALQDQMAMADKDLAAAQIQLDLLLLEATDEDVRQADIAYANAMLNQNDAERMLQSSTLKAASSGIIVQKYVERGAMVQAGQAILRLADASKLQLELDIATQELGSWSLGAEIQVKSEITGIESTGKVTEVSSIVNAGLGTRTVRVVLDNQDGMLQIGEEVQVWQAEQVSGILLPIEAVLFFGDSYVFVVNNDTVERRVVQLGKPLANNVQVYGLEAGERVVVAGMERLFAGDQVRIVDRGETK